MKNTMEKVTLKEDKICIATFKDKTRGRFDLRGTDTLYIQLSDNNGAFYTEKFTNIKEAKKEMNKFDIELQVI